MPELDGLRPDAALPAEPIPQHGPGTPSRGPEHHLSGPDRGREHAIFYTVLFLLLAGGSALLRSNPLWQTGPAWHTLVEAIATVLAFIVGGLSLVRFYSRKQLTFLFIGCGFLGAGLLDLNHALATSEPILDARRALDPSLRPGDLDAWTWTAERVFLSLFLFVSFLWRQPSQEREESALPEGWVYLNAVLMTVVSLMFFEWVAPFRTLTFPLHFIIRPGELVPAAFFLAAFAGFLWKGSWRTDAFEHWLLVSLLISVLAHAGFMAFSLERFDGMFDAAHLLKIASYVAILTGLLYSVYGTFRREGEVLGALTGSNAALAREIDVRARTERAVEESRARLQEFLDNANDLIQSVAPDGRILYVNSSWKRVLGYTDDDLERLRIFDIVHPAHRALLEREIQRVLDGGPSGRFDVNYVAADGRVVMLSGSMQAQRAGGRTVSTQSILRDVTEQRIAERQLEEAQRNLEALVENTGDSIWSVDREHRLITLNSAFALAVEARTGREPQVGQLPEEVFLPQDALWFRNLYDRTLAGERLVDMRSEEVDGQERFFEVFGNPIQSVEGVSGAVFFGRDITPRVRAQEALAIAKEEAVAANKAKSDFLANMSHELRTPLNSVIGFTNILLKNKEGRFSEKDLGFLERVLSNGKHLLALINEVLDLAKVEAGRMELIIEEVDLAALCVETVQQLEGQAKTKEGQVKLVADVPPEVSPVETDSAKLKQVIINLVGNALKFTHEGSVTVRLELAPDGRTPTAIAVIDTGIGIPQDRLEAIFEAFQQADAGTSRKYGGTGLGLALSRSICQLMGYDLMVESEVGKGSTFKIVLGERAGRAGKRTEGPVEEEAAAAPEAGPADAAVPVAAVAVEAADASPQPAREKTAAAARAAGGALRDFKVLVVDDEKDSRVLIAHYLEEFGCRVLTAGGGEQGLALAREHAPDLMTLDLIMPGMTGWEVLKRMKADPDLRRIPVVVVSVVAGEGRGSLLGAVDLVTKPFEREDLLRVLWRHLGRSGSGRVLLAVEAPDLRLQLTRFLTSRGLQVVAARPGVSPLDALRFESPDAVVFDLARDGAGVIEALEKLRADRIYAGLPTFALAAKELCQADRDHLHRLSTIVVSRDDPVGALDELLGVLFPVAEEARRAT
ncbi:MAG TPA: PAS domain S-box protein [Longimicrobiales bacterium]|nr:PAS domain S-box protein [Longimicrobiales bacterium]